MRDSLPEFNDYGALPVGDYAPTRADFELRFVDVPSSTRKAIYDGWGRHRTALEAAGLASSERQLLNGSFLTAKPDPGDLDLVVEVTTPDLSPSTQAGLAPVLQLLSGPGAKPKYSCDAYPLLVLPAVSPDFHAVTEVGRAYWMKWFGQDRLGRPKGRVWATVGGLP